MNSKFGNFPGTRMRRLRQSGWIRDLVAENRVHVSDLILPMFVIDGEGKREDIASLPGTERLSVDLAVDHVKKVHDKGIPAIALFPITPQEKKTDDGAEAYSEDNLICRAIHAIKSACPDIGIITDVALDPYTTHGHDGIIREGRILNDETVDILCKQAINQAKAGADIIAPSDMMDGRVGAIRKALDAEAFQDTTIMSYAAKYASAFYGPFRDAVKSQAALQGDKKTYQMNPANSDEALREVAMDISEGADMIIVKPALAYLDIISRVRQQFNMPTFGYHVSGELAMLKAAASNGWLDYDSCLMETILSFKRAGCDGILTYAALDIADILAK